MVQNRIKVLRAEVGISAKALAERVSNGVDGVAMSFIEGGRVLPTRDSLEAMCELFDCIPTDIYEKRELDLLAVRAESANPSIAEQTPPVAVRTVEQNAEDESNGFDTLRLIRKTQAKHEDMEQVRVWVPMVDKLALVKAIKGLGYRSIAEWLREMQRDTIQRYIALKIQNDISTDTLNHPSSNTCITTEIK